MTPIERLSIELTNRCGKGCAFCYNASRPAGETRWTPDEVVGLVRDCAAHGTRAVSFGGGEPLQYPGLFEVLERLRGVLGRAVTTNGLLLRGELLDRLVAAAPDKVHVSIHAPGDEAEVTRVVEQVVDLAARGVPSGVNLLVGRSTLAASTSAAGRLRAAGLGPERVVYLPMRGADTPTADEVGQVAGSARFQGPTCLLACGKSPRFAALSWDRAAAWCSYTTTRRTLEALTWDGLLAALDGLGLAFCGEASRAA